MEVLEHIIVFLTVAASAIYLVRYFHAMVRPKAGCSDCRCKVGLKAPGR